MASRRVLIVDDEPDIRKTLTDILRAMRYPDAVEIETAPDARRVCTRWCGSARISCSRISRCPAWAVSPC
jgi:CheY-like chemotaxis protein